MVEPVIGFWVFVLLFALLLASIPVWPYSRAWGVGPAGLVVALLVVWLGLVWFRFVLFAWPWDVEPAISPAPTPPGVSP